ncbi:class I SAM-dependent methyltransferase [Streptomyces sp. NPDC093970]|uniref:class I SAM-dependent methyltransferase n=1 Tax=Streptomyces sp. NPDC093970 TaxID=3155076 RepID=UPI0034272C79
MTDTHDSTDAHDTYWNHNVHYHPVVLDAVPPGCRAALDVGCGDGLLATALAARAESVTGVDRSAEMIRLAQKRDDPGNVTFLEGDYRYRRRLLWRYTLVWDKPDDGEREGGP